MRRWFLFILLIAIFVALVTAWSLAEQSNPALERAIYIESLMPEESFSVGRMPEIYMDELGRDYFMASRVNERGKWYIIAIRKPSAAKLPEGLIAEYDGGDFESSRVTNWRVGVAGENGRIKGQGIYSFRNLDNASISGYDNYNIIVIFPDYANKPSWVTDAMTEPGVKRIAYMRKRGFTPIDENVWQIATYVHSRELWLDGTTRSPTRFYLAMDDEELNALEVIGKNEVKYKSIKNRNLFNTGVVIVKGSSEFHLLTNAKGVKGFFLHYDVWDYEGEAYYRDVGLWKRVMAGVESATGVTAAPFSLSGLTSATLEWPSGNMGFDDYYDGRPMQKQTIADKKSLDKLKKLFGKPDYSDGGSNCPEGGFLTLTTKKGSVTIPLATDGCNTGAVAGRLLFRYGGQSWSILNVFDKIVFDRTTPQ